MPHNLSNGKCVHRERPDDLAIEFTLRHTDEMLSLTAAAIPFDRPDAHAAFLKNAVDRGEIAALTIAIDGVDCGLMTCAARQFHDGKELVIYSAYCNDQRISFLPIMKTCAIKIAIQHGCSSIRFHTVRKGLIREAMKLGFGVSEFVLRLPL